MKKSIRMLFVAMAFHFNHNAEAQNQHYFEIENSNEQTILKVEKESNKEGWTLINLNEDKYLLNYSNPEYTLWMNLLCKNSDKKPSYLIEYASKYRDGDFAGIDFASSSDTESKSIEFIVDGKNFKNPFIEHTLMNDFIASLKNGTKLDLKVYHYEFDVETETSKLVFNREMSFKLNHSELLDEKTNCN